MEFLDKINGPEDVKTLEREQLPVLCRELRDFLIDSVSHTGGHLASNLGIVELTVALHRAFDVRKDRLVFDVGHQSYVHKILTGRRDSFDTLRQFGGISGFPKPSESECDAFIAGHASNSVSVALGMARARTLKGENYDVIALIGDGALTGGLSYEGLSNAGESGERLVVVLNDNGMSITENVGGIARYLARERIKPGYLKFKKAYRKVLDTIPLGKYIYRFNHRIKTGIKNAILPCSMFEDMGFQYLGPVDGHNLDDLELVLSWAKQIEGPVLVHVLTKKGFGYEPAEENPDRYHGVGHFDSRVGVPEPAMGFSEVFGEKMTAMARSEKRLCAITAAMVTGTGLREFSETYPRRFFDVGIAEEHAVSMAAGLAKQGMIPVFAVYSTFLQRSYDQLIHDVAIQNLHVVLAVDRAGLSPGDGETHHGVFDVGYLCTVPNMTVMCPASYAELDSMLEFAVSCLDGPVAVRYPKGADGAYKGSGKLSASERVRSGEDFTVITYGMQINTAISAAEILEKQGVSVEILKLNFINPVDIRAVKDAVKKTGRVMILEECVRQGCVGQRIAAELAMQGIETESIILQNLGDTFVTHGDGQSLRHSRGIDAETVAKVIAEELEYE